MAEIPDEMPNLTDMSFNSGSRSRFQGFRIKGSAGRPPPVAAAFAADAAPAAMVLADMDLSADVMFTSKPEGVCIRPTVASKARKLASSQLAKPKARKLAARKANRPTVASTVFGTTSPLAIACEWPARLVEVLATASGLSVALSFEVAMKCG